VLQAGDAAQRRGLAAARGAEQDDDLTRGYVEAHVVDGGMACAEHLEQPLDLQFRRHRVS
jgi:hypothetical protein